MSRADYSILAIEIAKIKKDETRREAAIAVARALKVDNYRFDHSLFYAACRVSPPSTY